MRRYITHKGKVPIIDPNIVLVSKEFEFIYATISTICAAAPNFNNGEISILTSGDAPFLWDLFGPGGYNAQITGFSQADFTNLTAGTYSVNIYDTNGNLRQFSPIIVTICP